MCGTRIGSVFWSKLGYRRGLVHAFLMHFWKEIPVSACIAFAYGGAKVREEVLVHGAA